MYSEDAHNNVEVSIVNRSKRGLGISSSTPLQKGDIYRLETNEGSFWCVVIWYNLRKKRGGLLILSGSYIATALYLWGKMLLWIKNMNRSKPTFTDRGVISVFV